MAHYAYLGENAIVTAVITGREENELGIDWEAYYATQAGLPLGRVKRTSYNTHGGQHAAGGVPFRKNFAGVGFSYDAARDAFIPPAVDGATLDEESCLWVLPDPVVG